MEIETNKAEKALTNLSNKLDDAFSDYEVTVEMEKLEVPTFMQSLFPDFKSTNIKQLREIVEGSKDLFIGTNGEKAYKEYLKKLEKLEAKSATDRAKEYIKYVKIMLSEREKIENKYATIYSEIEKSSLPDEAKALAKYRLDSEMRAKIAKSEFEDFKKSYDYQLVFDNLDTVATSSIRRIRKEMQNLLDSKGSDLLPNDMKSLIDNIQKMDDKLAQRNPFKALADGIKEYQEAMKDLPEKQDSYNKSLLKSEDSQKRLVFAESKLEKARKQYGKDSKEYKKAEAELAKAKLDSAKSSDNLSKAHDDLQKAMNKGGDATEKIQAGIKSINTYAQEAGEAVTGLMKAFGASDDAVSSVQDVMQAVEGLSDVASGIARMESDPIGGIIQTAKGVAKIATALNSIHDSKFDREIRRQIRLVENLEEKYKDLERAIDKAYELDVIQGSFEEQKDIIESQNDAYLKMIAAERKKKDVSQKKIDEWEAAIKENNQRLEDLEMERLEQLGGINTKDAAEEFAEAWQEAFFETGDGLDALSNKFDDYMKNLILRQSMLKLGDKFMKPFIDSVNQAISDDSDGGARLTTAEMEEAMKLGEKAAENLNRAYKQMYDEWGITPDTFGTTDLSGLQKGIQGVTEETAGVIESYLNSLRYYATERNTEIRKIREIIEGQYGTGDDSPMLNEVRAIKALVNNIDNNLSSIVKSSASELGNGVRVFVG